MTLRERRRKRKMRYAVAAVLTVLLSALVGVGVWAVEFMDKIDNYGELFQGATATPGNAINNKTPLPGQSAIPDPNPTTVPDQPDYEWGKDVLNVLVMGYDSNQGRLNRDEFIFRTDVLILCTVYFNESRVVATWVPRDSYVPIGPNFLKKDKINSAFSSAQLAGTDPYEATKTTVSRLFGNVPIDYYIALDMDVFRNAVDALGGIEFDVPFDLWKYGKLMIKKGKQVLNGNDAMLYLTFRGDVEGEANLGDISRVNRQQEFVKAVFSQLKSVNKIVKLPEVYALVMDKMSTNLSYEQIAALANFAMKNMNGKDALTTKKMAGSFLDLNGVSYWEINQRERVLLIHELFKITIQPDEQD